MDGAGGGAGEGGHMDGRHVPHPGDVSPLGEGYGGPDMPDSGGRGRCAARAFATMVTRVVMRVVTRVVTWAMTLCHPSGGKGGHRTAVRTCRTRGGSGSSGGPASVSRIPCLSRGRRARLWRTAFERGREALGKGAHPTPDPPRSNHTSRFPEFSGEMTPKVAGESLIGTTYQGIDFCDCSDWS